MLPSLTRALTYPVFPGVYSVLGILLRTSPGVLPWLPHSQGLPAQELCGGGGSLSLHLGGWG